MHAGNPPSEPAPHRRRTAHRSVRRRFAYLGLVCVAALGARAQTPSPAPPAFTDARPILRELEIRSHAQLDDDELDAWIDLPLGEPLDPRNLRRTLTALHAGGRFITVDWWIQPLEGTDQVRGVLVLVPHPTLRKLHLTGETGFEDDELRRRMRQEEGAMLDDAHVEAGLEALRRLYRRSGYFEATVEARLSPAGPALEDLIVHIDSGPRAHIGTRQLHGIPDGLVADAEKKLRLDAGRLFDDEELQEDAERLRRFLVERGFFEAQVETPQADYRRDDQVVDLTFRVQAGPVFELALEGIGKGKLKRGGFLPFLEDRPFDETLWTQSCARLRHAYQAKGHYAADVECGSEREPGVHRLSLRLTPGPVYTVRGVELDGPSLLPAGRLEDLLGTTTKTRFSPGSGRLVGPELDADLDRLRSYYLLEGFADVQVGPAVVEQKGTDLYVRIPIDEGVRRRVVGIEVRAAERPGTLSEPLPVPDPTPRLPLHPGGGFHPLLVDDSVNLIRALYEEEGYALAVVTPSLDWNDDRTLVDVTLTVDPGPRRRLDRLVLRGLQHTRPELVERFFGLRSGDVLSRRGLLKAERDLYRLGIFSEVDVDLAPTASLGADRDVRVRLREGRRWRVSYGVSYHSDDGIGGLFGLSRTNIRGLGERLQLDLRASENDRRLRLIYDQPSFGSRRLPVTYTLFSRFELRESFEVRENGARVSLARDLDGLRLGLVYDYRFVEIAEDVPGTVDPSTLEREDTAVEITSLAPHLFIDRRDDPLNPTVGWSTALQLEYAFPLLSAETELIKLFGRQTLYRKLGEWGILAGSARLGLIEPLSRPETPDPFLPPDLASSRVPISERFFAGGRTTHRAYERDRLGLLGESLVEAPDGRLIESGGNAMLLFNLDYRFPLSGPVEGVAFVDAGNLWADWRHMDLGDLRPGAGLGVRYASPVGPIRLEIGWKLDPQPWEDTSPVFFLSFGNPF